MAPWSSIDSQGEQKAGADLRTPWLLSEESDDDGRMDRGVRCRDCKMRRRV